MSDFKILACYRKRQGNMVAKTVKIVDHGVTVLDCGDFYKLNIQGVQDPIFVDGLELRTIHYDLIDKFEEKTNQLNNFSVPITPLHMIFSFAKLANDGLSTDIYLFDADQYKKDQCIQYKLFSMPTHDNHYLTEENMGLFDWLNKESNLTYDHSYDIGLLSRFGFKIKLNESGSVKKHNSNTDSLFDEIAVLNLKDCVFKENISFDKATGPVCVYEDENIFLGNYGHMDHHTKTKLLFNRYFVLEIPGDVVIDVDGKINQTQLVNAETGELFVVVGRHITTSSVDIDKLTSLEINSNTHH